MPGSNTRYFPGGAATEIDTGYAPPAPPAFGGGAAPGLPGMPDFNAAIQAKLAIEAERERRAAQLHRLQLRAMTQQLRAGDAPPPGTERNGMQAEAEAIRLNSMREDARLRNAKPSDFGRFRMNHTGNWGTSVDPADIPASLQGTIMGGMYGEAGNWDTSNPSITGPQQLTTGKYTRNASGAGSGGPMRLDAGGPALPQEDERADWSGLRSRRQAEAMRRG